MTKLILLLVLLAVLLLLGAAEGLLHRRNLERIPIRIHVNGTRGKSSVARLIAGGLRAGGIVTCAKTTGTEAAMILPDGSEYAIYRVERAADSALIMGMGNVHGGGAELARLFRNRGTARDLHAWT